MFKNQYDTEVSSWSPQGRLYQVEYAMEAVKQGSVTVGVKSKHYVVLASLKRTPHADFASYQGKSFTISKNCGVSIAGLIPDARILARYMRTECMNYEYENACSIPIGQIADFIGRKSQWSTMSVLRRPFGVGMLLAGTDDSGVHLLQTCPSGHVYDSIAAAIGSRCQSARTYLERNFNNFETAQKEELVMHALKALAATCGEGVKLSSRNTSISTVAIGEPFTTLEDEAAGEWLEKLVILPEDRVAETMDEPLQTEDFIDDEEGL